MARSSADYCPQDFRDRQKCGNDQKQSPTERLTSQIWRHQNFKFWRALVSKLQSCRNHLSNATILHLVICQALHDDCYSLYASCFCCRSGNMQQQTVLYIQVPALDDQSRPCCHVSFVFGMHVLMSDAFCSILACVSVIEVLLEE